MTQEQKDKLVAAWIESHSKRDDELTREQRLTIEEEYSWVLDEISDIFFENPELTWEIILQIHRTEHTEWAMMMLAAGPLEDLLANHGKQFIDRVEAEARRDPKFNYMLGGVWRNSMTDEVWERVQAIRRDVW